MKTQISYYSPEQVADILQVSKNMVYELIGSGELYAKKVGRVYRVPSAAIDYFTHNMDYHKLVRTVQERGVHPSVLFDPRASAR